VVLQLDISPVSYTNTNQHKPARTNMDLFFDAVIPNPSIFKLNQNNANKVRSLDDYADTQNNSHT